MNTYLQTRNKKEWVTGRIKVKPIHDGYYESRKLDVLEAIKGRKWLLH